MEELNFGIGILRKRGYSGDARLVVFQFRRQNRIEGGNYERYRIWHLEDHIHASYETRLPDGSIGPRAFIRLVECLGKNQK
ncbi:hypothetical protein AB3N59_17490 [Leptospira sp. WS92.C1]